MNRDNVPRELLSNMFRDEFREKAIIEGLLGIYWLGLQILVSESISADMGRPRTTPLGFRHLLGRMQSLVGSN